MSFPLCSDPVLCHWLIEHHQAGKSRVQEQGESGEVKLLTTERPVLMPKTKAGLFPHYPRNTPCAASPLLHHRFHNHLLPTSSSSNSLGQSSLPSHLAPAQPSNFPLTTNLHKLLRPTVWPMPHSPNTPCNYATASPAHVSCPCPS